MLKFFLMAMTLIAVLSDAMLLPFYPQYFAQRFGITDSLHVGSYFAAICLTAMLALPLWARLTRRICTLRLLIVTQAAAGLLSIACSLSTSLWLFWLLSLTMIVCKASYLLIYPYIMADEPEQAHSHTIGLLSIIVHFGSIAGALIGGAVLEFWTPERAFLVMALGDFLQMAVCVVLVWRGLARPVCAASASAPVGGGGPRVLALGVLMLVFYFSEYQIAPFFVEYWRSLVPGSGPLLSAMIYAIPAAMALLALEVNRRSRQPGFLSHVPSCLGLGILGLGLQASGVPALVLIGRCLFGWSLFQVTVRLDARLFELSTPAAYARDYSTINLFQNLGVMMSSFSAGAVIAAQGLHFPFWLAIIGYGLTLLLYPLLLRPINPLVEADAHAKR